MAELIKKESNNGKYHIKVNFHAPVKNFKRVEQFKYQGRFYQIYIDKNNSVWKVEQSKVATWKEIQKGKRLVRIPETFTIISEPELNNKVRGNTYDYAIQRIMTELERELI